MIKVYKKKGIQWNLIGQIDTDIEKTDRQIVGMFDSTYQYYFNDYRIDKINENDFKRTYIRNAKQEK